LAWTGGQPFLTQKLCQLVLDAESLIPSGEEKLWIENLVRSHIIESWESQDEPEHLRKYKTISTISRNSLNWLHNFKIKGYLLKQMKHGTKPVEFLTSKTISSSKLCCLLRFP
jgi:hypothetical protein